MAESSLFEDILRGTVGGIGASTALSQLQAARGILRNPATTTITSPPGAPSGIESGSLASQQAVLRSLFNSAPSQLAPSLPIARAPIGLRERRIERLRKVMGGGFRGGGNGPGLGFAGNGGGNFGNINPGDINQFASNYGMAEQAISPAITRTSGGSAGGGGGGALGFLGTASPFLGAGIGLAKNLGLFDSLFGGGNNAAGVKQLIDAGDVEGALQRLREMNLPLSPSTFGSPSPSIGVTDLPSNTIDMMETAPGMFEPSPGLGMDVAGQGGAETGGNAISSFGSDFANSSVGKFLGAPFTRAESFTSGLGFAPGLGIFGAGVGVVNALVHGLMKLFPLGDPKAHERFLKQQAAEFSGQLNSGDIQGFIANAMRSPISGTVAQLSDQERADLDQKNAQALSLAVQGQLTVDRVKEIYGPATYIAPHMIVGGKISPVMWGLVISGNMPGASDVWSSVVPERQAQEQPQNQGSQLYRTDESGNRVPLYGYGDGE